MATAFDETNTVTEPEDYFEALVGEGKKFKDPNELAKGKWKSDQHIKNLERQLEEMREDLGKAHKLEELMELVRAQNKATSATEGARDNSFSGNGGTDPNRTDVDKLDPDEIKALVTSQLKEHETTSRRQRNLEEVDNALAKRFGDNKAKAVKDTADSLGMSVEELRTLAETNPKAFMRLMGDTNRSESSVTVGGSTRSEANLNGNRGDVRNFKWYQEQRKKLGAKYYAPAFQMQMMKDAENLGSDFYN